MCVAPNWLLPFFDGEKITYRFVGSLKEGFEPQPLFDYSTGEVFEPFQVGCGKCLDCIQLHKIEWIHRIQDEASLYKDNAFITLTYHNSLKNSETVVSKETARIFIRELRRAIYPRKIRYYLCGEYGSKRGRAHYHAVIFNYSFPDKRFFKFDKKGFPIYRSDFLESIWNPRFIPYAGFSGISNVCEKTLEYVTKDMQKMQYTYTDCEDVQRPDPFVLMSLKPGIGARAAPVDVPADGRIWHEGKSVLLPRYYKKLLVRQGKEKEVALFNKKLAAISDLRQIYSDPDLDLQKYEKKSRDLLDKKKIL